MEKMYSHISIHGIEICTIAFHQICVLLWLCILITQALEKLGKQYGY